MKAIVFANVETRNNVLQKVLRHKAAQATLLEERGCYPDRVIFY